VWLARALAGAVPLTGKGVSDQEISGFGHRQQHQYKRYGEDFVYGEGFLAVLAHKFTGS